MKQHITSEQLAQLTDLQKEKLREWWEPQDEDMVEQQGLLPLLSIARMIELLAERLARITHIPASPKHPARWHVIVYVDVHDNKVIPLREITAPNLTDALWQAVKEVLA